MEKQLALFNTEENDDLSIWLGLPEKVRQETETLFAKLLIKHLCESLKEVLNDEK
jgi:hypothetical protein